MATPKSSASFGREYAYAQYQDENGEPQFALSSVLFFDLLGIRAMATSPEALDHLRQLRPALDAAIERAGTDDQQLPQASTWFTDNVVVGVPQVREEHSEIVIGGMEVTVAYLLLVCWGRGFLGRGAITYGEHYMDERFVFGPALIEAVELEKQAKWPRVVLGESAIEAERAHVEYYGVAEESTQNTCLLRDEEDIVFVDHLGIYIDEEDAPDALDYFLDLHRRATEEGLAAHPAEGDIWMKWRWLADYQNHTLRGRLKDPDPFLVDVPDTRFQFKTFVS